MSGRAPISIVMRAKRSGPMRARSIEAILREILGSRSARSLTLQLRPSFRLFLVVELLLTSPPSSATLRGCQIAPRIGERRAQSF
eukprot:8512744-Pyramimonas_sp.AAC.1